jgi:hypothetical protein
VVRRGRNQGALIVAIDDKDPVKLRFMLVGREVIRCNPERVRISASPGVATSFSVEVEANIDSGCVPKCRASCASESVVLRVRKVGRTKWVLSGDHTGSPHIGSECAVIDVQVSCRDQEYRAAIPAVLYTEPPEGMIVPQTALLRRSSTVYEASVHLGMPSSSLVVKAIEIQSGPLSGSQVDASIVSSESGLSLQLIVHAGCSASKRIYGRLRVVLESHRREVSFSLFLHEPYVRRSAAAR